MNKKKQLRRKRKLRIRAKISGTKARPRLAVYRSNTTLFVQLIDDEARITLVSAKAKGKNKDAAKKLGQEIAQAAKAKHITHVVFDRGGYRYHGVIHELAQAVREGGIEV